MYRVMATHLGVEPHQGTFLKVAAFPPGGFCVAAWWGPPLSQAERTLYPEAYYLSSEKPILRGAASAVL